MTDPGHELAFTVVDDKHDREETLWHYRMVASGKQTVLTETYEYAWCPLVARIAEMPVPRSRRVRQGIEQTLERVKAEAEQLQRARSTDRAGSA